MNDSKATEQINEGNILIADFCKLHKTVLWGGVDYLYGIERLPPITIPVGTTGINATVNTRLLKARPDQLVYHSSWDWLIPVWRKVNLAIKGVIGKAKEDKPGLYHTSLDAKLQFACDTFNNAVFQNNPLAAQRIIVGLIEWLNDNIAEQN